ncbi:MAG: cbb3-type cytochrome oxidase assembly protein [Burkholderiales bacterium]|nr:cbb3-type cytochrome oxidase assembly protein [Burkholderiales bacterium]
MSILVFLIGLSIVVLIGAGVVLFWAVDHGQFDDMETPGLLPLADADAVVPPDQARAATPAHAAPDEAR